MPREALIVGLGLIGGSVGMALRRRGWRVTYVDPFVELEEARRQGAADERAGSIDGELIVIATAVDIAVEIVAKLDSAGVVTSTCSMMQPLRDAARTELVAGHPMAGSHERTLAAARADLFEGKRWFLDRDDARVKALVADCGAVPEIVDAAEHDAAVAVTSHLPQVLSTALAAWLDDQPDVLRFAGEGLRTFLRLAGSDAVVWAPIIDANRERLATHADAVARLAREIIEGDPHEAFAKAQRFWRRL